MTGDIRERMGDETMMGELSQAQIEQVLHSELIGRLGCHAAGQTYVVPITYAYDGTNIYGHSGEGLKIRMMRENPAVCFEVDQMDDMRNWRGVIAQGVYEELHGAAAEHAMQVLIDRVMPLLTSETSRPQPRDHGSAAGSTAVIYRIALQEKTGRFEQG
jgi:nitroimidazol reductase NimA-like FMN-containing flavoprotein (pyridoxamine 5'-phosphate oxidase superfamily)